jgi:hypothetical protein
LSKMASLACLKGKMQLGLAEYVPFHWTDRAQAWWDALPPDNQTELSQDWHASRYKRILLG